MNSQPSDPGRRVSSRREFIKTTGAVAAMAAGTGFFNLAAAGKGNRAGEVSIVLDPTAPVTQEEPVRWAAEHLRDTLLARGVAAVVVRDGATAATADCIFVTGSGSANTESTGVATASGLPEGPESFSLARRKIGRRSVLLAAGADTRGLVYALLELADQVQCAAEPMPVIREAVSVREKPANPIRGVARAFVSDVEDKAWFGDRDFWRRYLTVLATHRFNRFHLMLGVGYDFTTNITDCYFHFAYPFLVNVAGYSVRAVPLPDAERDANLEQLRFISDEAARRGLHFQLGLWTHAYQWTNSPRANYVIQGLTPATHGPYCREALRTVLQACPNIRGVTFRIHGESGVPEGNYGLWKTIFDGAAQCGRRVEIDMHAKGMDQGMIDAALGTGLPVTISPKFWAEHMGLPYMQGAIRPEELPRDTGATGFFSRSSGARSFLRYGYGDLLREDRRYGVLHRMWPGTQRLLTWGDPETADAYGRVSGFCGSGGLELMEPLTFKGRKGSGLPGGRDGYVDAAWQGPDGDDFQKFLPTYRIWGRSLYNPNGDAAGKRRWLECQFGSAAGVLGDSLAWAGKILPLVTTAHCPSAANNNYWPEMYFNMPIVDARRPHPYSDTPSPKRLGTVSSLDPEFFLGIDEFADELLKGESGGKYSPAWVATQLETAAAEAEKELRRATHRLRDPGNIDFRRLAADIGIQAGLGRFFAAKFRAGTLFAIYLRTRQSEALEQAVVFNRRSRDAWAGFAEHAKGIYRSDLTFGPEYFQRGHWLDRLEAMDADIADMERFRSTPALPPEAARGLEAELKNVEHAMAAATAQAVDAASGGVSHDPMASFRRGQPLRIICQAHPASQVNLRYRRVNQADMWQSAAMDRTDRQFQAVIPAEYTDSPFPLQYHFQIRGHEGGVWLFPGLRPGWLGQPYFTVRQG